MATQYGRNSSIRGEKLISILQQQKTKDSDNQDAKQNKKIDRLKKQNTKKLIKKKV